MSDAEALKKSLRRTRKQVSPPTAEDYLSTGCTLANLAVSSRADGGFPRGYYSLLVGDSEAGKAQPLDARVLTLQGWVRMGRIQVGDSVIDPDGGAARVEGVFPKGMREVFRVTFSDGGSTECCDEHLWLTATSVERQRDRRAGRGFCESVKTLEEIRATILSSWQQHAGRFNHYIPLMQAAEFPKLELPLPPYLMGVLLGNGHFGEKTVRLSSGEQQIIDRARLLVPASCETVHRKGVDWTIRGPRRGATNDVLEAVRDMGLGHHLAADKFIPRAYLRTCTQDRVDLLNGLMDTDGYATKRGGASIEYCTVSQRMCKDFVELVRTLGGVCSITTKRPTYEYEGEKRKGQLAYTIRPALPGGILPFTLARKAERFTQRDCYKPIRYIVAVEPVGRKPCQCILVSTKRNLYVTDDYIVTHNTFLALQSMAEAANNPTFKGYRLIYDKTERRADRLDMPKFFGTKLVDRLEGPCPRGYSRTSEEFYDNVAAAAARKVPFIYLLDSEDALDAEAALKKARSNRKARTTQAADKVKGSYGMDKAKLNSSGLREAHNSLEATRSILLIIKQSRQNTDLLTAKIKPKTRSGGLALTFYAAQELWFSIRGKLRKKVHGIPREVGSLLRIKVTKNSESGWHPIVDLPFYPSVGFDEIGSMVNFLIEEGVWKEAKGGIIEAPEFGEAQKEDGLIAFIEDNNLEEELRKLTVKTWKDVEAQCSVTRKPRYA